MGNEMGNQNTSGLQGEEILEVQEPIKTSEASMMDPIAKTSEDDQTPSVPDSKNGDFQEKLTSLTSEKQSEKNDQIDEQRSNKRAAEEKEELRYSSLQINSTTQEPELLELVDQKSVEQESTTMIVPESALEEESNRESQEITEGVVPEFDPFSNSKKKEDIQKNEMEQTVTNSSLEEKNEKDLQIQQTQLQERLSSDISNKHEEKLNISNSDCQDRVEGLDKGTTQMRKTGNREDGEQNIAKDFAETQLDLVPEEESLNSINADIGDTEVKSVILVEKKEMENKCNQKTGLISDEHVKGLENEVNKDGTGTSQTKVSLGDTNHEEVKEEKDNGSTNQSKSLLDSEINGDEVSISSLSSSDSTEKNVDDELMKRTENLDSSDLRRENEKGNLEERSENQSKGHIPIVTNSISEEDILEISISSLSSSDLTEKNVDDELIKRTENSDCSDLNSDTYDLIGKKAKENLEEISEQHDHIVTNSVLEEDTLEISVSPLTPSDSTEKNVDDLMKRTENLDSSDLCGENEKGNLEERSENQSKGHNPIVTNSILEEDILEISISSLSSSDTIEKNVDDELMKRTENSDSSDLNSDSYDLIGKKAKENMEEISEKHDHIVTNSVLEEDTLEISISPLTPSDSTEKNVDELMKRTENLDSSDLCGENEKGNLKERSENQSNGHNPIVTNSISEEDILEISISSLSSSDTTEKNVDDELMKRTENSDSYDLIGKKAKENLEEISEEHNHIVTNSVLEEDTLEISISPLSSSDSTEKNVDELMKRTENLDSSDLCGENEKGNLEERSENQSNGHNPLVTNSILEEDILEISISSLSSSDSTEKNVDDELTKRTENSDNCELNSDSYDLIGKKAKGNLEERSEEDNPIVTNSVSEEDILEISISSLSLSDSTEKNVDHELTKRTENSDSSDLIENSASSDLIGENTKENSEERSKDQPEKQNPIVINSVSEEDIYFWIEKNAQEKTDGGEDSKPIKILEEHLGSTGKDKEERIDGLKDRLEEQKPIRNSVSEEHGDSIRKHAEEKIEGGSEDRSEEQNHITDSVSKENVDSVGKSVEEKIMGRSDDRSEEQVPITNSIPEKHEDRSEKQPEMENLCPLDFERRNTRTTLDENLENPLAMMKLDEQRSDNRLQGLEAEDGKTAKLVSSASEFIKQVIILEQKQEQEHNEMDSDTLANRGSGIIGLNKENLTKTDSGEKNLTFDSEHPTVNIEASAVETQNEESERDPIQNREKIVKTEVPEFEKSDSVKLRNPPVSYPKEKTHVLAPLEKQGRLIARKSVDEAWCSPGKKSMRASSSSPIEKEKQKGRSSFFSNCMCCTAVIR